MKLVPSFQADAAMGRSARRPPSVPSLPPLPPLACTRDCTAARPAAPPGLTSAGWLWAVAVGLAAAALAAALLLPCCAAGQPSSALRPRKALQARDG